MCQFLEIFRFFDGFEFKLIELEKYNFKEMLVFQKLN